MHTRKHEYKNTLLQLVSERIHRRKFCSLVVKNLFLSFYVRTHTSVEYLLHKSLPTHFIDEICKTAKFIQNKFQIQSHDHQRIPQDYVHVAGVEQL